MSRNYYAEINLHIVWHTKNSEPCLTPEIERVAQQSIRDRLLKTPGAVLHALGGTEDHLHLAVSVPPTLRVCDLIGELKGGSSHAVNQFQAHLPGRFAWQDGYGVVTFGTRDLPWVVRYIENQKQHHARGTVEGRLEAASPPVAP